MGAGTWLWDRWDGGGEVLNRCGAGPPWPDVGTNLLLLSIILLLVGFW